MSQFEPAAMAKRASNPDRANVSQLNGHAADVELGASESVIEVKPVSRRAEFKAKLVALVDAYADVAGISEDSYEFWQVWMKEDSEIADRIGDHEANDDERGDHRRDH
jgi:hypothetical protein